MGKFAALDPVKDPETGAITIMVPKVRVRRMVEALVEQIRKGCEEEPTLAESIWLYELVKEDILPRAESPPSFLTPCIRLGVGSKHELRLYEPTVAAMAWLSEYASQWWGSEEDLPPAVFAYAHSGGSEDTLDAFLKLTDESAKVKVEAWFKKLNHPLSLLMWACDRLSGKVEEGYEELELNPACMSLNPSDTPLDWGEVVSQLAIAYGLPAKHFANMNQSLAVDMWEAKRDSPIITALGGSSGKARGGKAMLACGAAVRKIIENHLSAGKSDA